MCSVTTNLNVSVVPAGPTSGAVKVGFFALLLESVIPAGGVHVYARVAPGCTVVALPSSVTVSPSQTAVGNIVKEEVGPAVWGAGLIVTVSALVPVPLPFVAVMLPLNGPAVVGVPENAPVAAEKLTPGIDTVVPQPPEAIAWFAI